MAIYVPFRHTLGGFLCLGSAYRTSSKNRAQSKKGRRPRDKVFGQEVPIFCRVGMTLSETPEAYPQAIVPCLTKLQREDRQTFLGGPTFEPACIRPVPARFGPRASRVCSPGHYGSHTDTVHYLSVKVEIQVSGPTAHTLWLLF